MAAYNINLEGDTLQVSFGDPAPDNVIVEEAVKRIGELIATDLLRGSLIKINGSLSIPVAIALGHELGHRYATVAVFVPKLGQYVVAIAHYPPYKPGDLID